MDLKRNRKNIESGPTAGAMADCVLPEDMMLCILTRLPVKSIHRFKSVCKPLRDVLSSPSFAKMHRSQFPLNPENQLVIIRKRILKYEKTISMFKIDSDDVENKPISSLQAYYTPEAVYIIGCCNGLICMSFIRGKDKRRLALWNPALNMSICLPAPELEIESPNSLSLGFGYNEEADDFKVIMIVESRKIENSVVVMVYSSSSNSWSKIGVGFQFIPHSFINNAIVNGSPYWEVSFDRKWVVVCFDVREMVFKIVPRLDSFSDMLFVNWKGDFGAIVFSKDNDQRVVSLDVWVFNDVGNIGWTKKCSFGSMELNAVNVNCLLQCWKNGKILIGELEDGRLFVYDTENGVVVIDKVENVWWSDVYGEYTESLAYIKGMDKKGMERPILYSL